jgi:glycosyltransferase involved in cell wall biosynthesis
VLRVTLLTRGSPESVSGGFLYHRRMRDASSEHDAVVTFAQESWWWWWSPGLDTDVAVIDSIAAARMLPAVLRRRRVPFVAIVHQRAGGAAGPRAWRAVMRRLDHAVYRRCRTVIAASETLARSLLDDRAVAPDRLVVIEPGCDVPPGTPSGDMRLGRRTAVLCVANWYPNKGLLELLDAVATLPEDAATLHLAGRDDVDPAYTARVRARLAAPDLAGRAVVHGTVDLPTVAGLYAGADVFALATSVEGYATVFAEALACGLPVVGWRLPFLEHFVRDGVEGRLAEHGDRAALARALADVVGDDDARRHFAEAAARRGSTLPTWHDTATRFFAELRRSAAAAVEPAHHGTVVADVDAADAGVLDVQPPRQRGGDAEGPLDGRLDRADVGHDHDGGRRRED